ncbi:MAG: trigger factor [Campylobacterales bacterium]
MEFKVEQKDRANYSVKVAIPAEEVKKELKRVAKEWAKKVRLDGFRPGKVPVAVVEKLYKAAIEDEGIQKLVEKAEKGALSQVEGQVVGVALRNFNRLEDQGIELEFLVGIAPKVEIGEEYLECVPKLETPEVTEEELQRELEKVAEEMGETKVVREENRELGEGDIAIIDFIGYIDGKPFEGGKAEGYSLKIGSGQFIDGFEEQLKGMKVGETRRIKVQFPADYHSRELAGKEAEFEVTLQEIQEFKPREIDDAAAKEYLNDEGATLETLKNYLKQRILERKKRELFEQQYDQILECWLQKYQLDLPEVIVEQELENILNQEASNLSPAELEELRTNREKLEELKKRFEPEARDRVKLTFLLKELIEKEKVEADQNELLSQIYYEALITGQNYKELVKMYQEQGVLPVLKMELEKVKLLNKLLEQKFGKSEQKKSEGDE